MTTVARKAIGLQGQSAPGERAGSTNAGRQFVGVEVGAPADFVLLHHNVGVQDAICSPSYDRMTIKSGRIVCRRMGTATFS